MRVVQHVVVGLTVSVLVVGPIRAAEVALQITDGQQRPVADAVITLVPQKADATAPVPRSLPARQFMGQRFETFIPAVLIVPQGGQVVFTNEDATRHHVYSFSPAKAFEMVLAQGETSEPVKFDRTGVVAIGCNIHDRMVAHVYVTDLPWGALTDKEGRASFSSIPDGTYVARLWHPRLRPGRPEPAQVVTVSGGATTVEASLDLVPGWGHSRDRERVKY